MGGSLVPSLCKFQPLAFLSPASLSLPLMVLFFRLSLLTLVLALPDTCGSVISYPSVHTVTEHQVPSPWFLLFAASR